MINIDIYSFKFIENIPIKLLSFGWTFHKTSLNHQADTSKEIYVSTILKLELYNSVGLCNDCTVITFNVQTK